VNAKYEKMQSFSLATFLIRLALPLPRLGFVPRQRDGCAFPQIPNICNGEMTGAIKGS
jgi:hypothetical protein